MNASKARITGSLLSSFIEGQEYGEARDLLLPILAEPIHFRLLDLIGAPIGETPAQAADPFLDWIGSTRAMGGWVNIGSALRRRVSNDLARTLDLTHNFIVLTDIWYGTDILGERVVGPALLERFDTALEEIGSWRYDENRWVRRAVGVGAHFWAKRSQGIPGTSNAAQALLEFLSPMFSENDIDAIKGVGWGLKTLGRFYPDLVSDWLIEQVCVRKRSFRALMVRKALTYLPEARNIRVQLSNVNEAAGD